MSKWNVTMKTRGFLKDHLFYLRTLTVCTVLSTGLLIYNQVNNTSAGNTSGKNANLKVESVGSHLKVIGSGITDRVPNSKTTSNSLEKSALPERSSACTGHLEGSTMKKRDSFFFTTF